MFKYFKFINNKSIIHSLNPFLKLIITICFIISCFLAKSLFAYLFLMMFLLIVLIFSCIPDFKYYEHVYNYKFLILVVLLFDLIINFSLKSLILTLISSIFSILMLGAYVFTTKPRDLYISLETLLSPLKLFGLNTKKIAFKTISLGIYKPIFLENKKSLEKEAKNLDLNLKFIDKIKLIHKNTLLKIDELNEMMIVRNYFIFKNDIYEEKVKARDYLFAVTEFLLFIAIIVRG